MAERPFVMRLIEDRLSGAPAAIAELAACHRTLYMVEGEVGVTGGGVAASLPAGGGWYGKGAITLAAAANGARLWRCEVIGGETEPPAGGGTREWSVRALLVQRLKLDTAARHLIRLERVDFTLGAHVPSHRHMGPGIRCLYQGRMRIRQGGHDQEHGVGEPWYESGVDSVIADAAPGEPTGFIRTMVAPVMALGRPTAIFAPGTDQSFRRGVRRFIDLPIEL
ncbi:MAG: hypothetical protein EXQ96_01520 [Alphaproteobacteria bacterium]|nr:hypothetical protein [Alphaproteobacteria bacterium]